MDVAELDAGDIDIVNDGDASLVINADNANEGGHVSEIIFTDGPEGSSTEIGRIISSDDNNSVTYRAGTGNSLVFQTNGANTRMTVESDGDIVAGANVLLNTSNSLRLREDQNHALRYAGDGVTAPTFAGINVNGPALYGFSGGILGLKNMGDERISFKWNSTVSSLYGEEAITVDVHCNTGNSGNHSATLSFKDGTYTAPTTMASLVAQNSLNSFVIRSEAGRSLTLQTNGANDRLTIASNGTGTWTSPESIEIQSTNTATSGKISTNNSGVILNNHLEVPLFASGSIQGGSSFGTTHAGTTAMIWARIDGNWASNDPNAIVAQSGGIADYVKNEAGDYIITLDATIFDLGHFTATANAQNTNIVASVRPLSATTVQVKLYDVVGAAAVDDIFQFIIVGKVKLTVP